MPGPNSAPNGDAGLVRGYEGEEFVYVERRIDGETVFVKTPLRFVRKITGKTSKKL